MLCPTIHHVVFLIFHVIGVALNKSEFLINKGKTLVHLSRKSFQQVFFCLSFHLSCKTLARKLLYPSKRFMLSNRTGLLVRGLGTRHLCSSNMAEKGSALVILAEGAEEMEAVITTDVLRRGKVSF